MVVKEGFMCMLYVTFVISSFFITSLTRSSVLGVLGLAFLDTQLLLFVVGGSWLCEFFLMEMDTFQAPQKLLFSIFLSLLLHTVFFLFSTKITTFILETKKP